MQLPALCEGDGAKLESSGSGKGQRANRFDLFFFSWLLYSPGSVMNEMESLGVWLSNFPLSLRLPNRLPTTDSDHSYSSVVSPALLGSPAAEHHPRAEVPTDEIRNSSASQTTIGGSTHPDLRFSNYVSSDFLCAGILGFISQFGESHKGLFLLTRNILHNVSCKLLYLTTLSISEKRGEPGSPHR